jgi:hypothetical protein
MVMEKYKLLQMPSETLKGMVMEIQQSQARLTLSETMTL